MIVSVNAKEELVLNVDWPGWPLADNKYGHEFDYDARIRMITGGRKLIPFIAKYKNTLGSTFLEIGPFFNPLLKSNELDRAFPDARQEVFFLENDYHAANWLIDQYNCQVLNINLNGQWFKTIIEVELEKHGIGHGVDSIIISQVLNYVNSAKLLKELFDLLSSGGYLFLNNVCNYGLPPLFSVNRCTSNEDIIKTCQEIGYEIVEFEILPPLEKEPEGRLLIVLRKG